MLLPGSPALALLSWAFEFILVYYFLVDEFLKGLVFQYFHVFFCQFLDYWKLSRGPFWEDSDLLVFCLLSLLRVSFECFPYNVSI